jgi:hypothetical protein
MYSRLRYGLPSTVAWLSMLTFLLWKQPRSIQAYHPNALGPIRRCKSHISMTSSYTDSNMRKAEKGKLLVLGGTGFLGQTICKRASLEGYAVTSLSRRGLPSPEQKSFGNAEYRQGDARKVETIANILNEGGYVGKSQMMV